MDAFYVPELKFDVKINQTVSSFEVQF